MAEPALALNDNWAEQQMLGDSLRQKKMEQFHNAQMLRSQAVSANSRVNEQLMSRQPNQPNQPEKTAEDSNDKQNKVAGGDLSDSLNQAKQLAKLAANPTPVGLATTVAEQAKDALKDGAAEVSKLASGQILKTWWMTLIDSWGLTLIPLNFQAWVGFTEGHKYFCKLGEEWKAPGLFKKAIGLLEVAAMLTLDFIVFLLILFVLTLLILLVDAMIHPIQNFKILWDLFGGAISSLR